MNCPAVCHGIVRVRTVVLKESGDTPVQRLHARPATDMPPPRAVGRRDRHLDGMKALMTMTKLNVREFQEAAERP
jgi:hypothetical protein